MTEPIISEQAQADLLAAWDYLSEKSLSAADKLIDRFAAAARVHALFPESGKSREELKPGLRSFVVRPYVAFYRPFEGTIEVLRFLHGKRDIRRSLSGDE
jgi:toxin ParE1/3/4